MAQLKDTVVQGSLRVTDTTYTNDLIIAASKTKNYFLASPSAADGSPIFRAIDATDLPTASTSDFGIMKVGTGLGVSSGTVSITYGTAANTALQGNQTLFKLNGSNKSASTSTSIYAPTAAGTSGYILASQGSGAPNWIQKVPIANGGTNATTAADARANLSAAPYVQSIFYGTCDTAATTQLKQVILVNGEGFTLSAGVTVAVKFTYASAEKPMAIQFSTDNGTTYGTDKTLCTVSNSMMGDNTKINGWAAGAIVIFIYDGAKWIRSYWYNSNIIYESGGSTFNVVNGVSELKTFLIQMSKGVEYQGIATINCRNMPEYTYLLENVYTCILSCIQSVANTTTYESGTAILIPACDYAENYSLSSNYLHSYGIVVVSFKELTDTIDFQRLLYPGKNQTYNFTILPSDWLTDDEWCSYYNCNAYCQKDMPLLRDGLNYCQVIVGMDTRFENRSTFVDEQEAIASAYLQPIHAHRFNVENDAILLACHGEIPTINLHITVMIVG